jgi:uncharacterized phage-associated protein
MTLKYSAIDIANYFICKAQEETEDDRELISNLKLQKLVYYAQGLHLAIYGEPLFDDIIEAWQYGPVVPDLYHLYKTYGAQGIPVDGSYDISKIDNDTKEFLNEIYDLLRQFSAVGLMNMAHSDECWISAGIGNAISHDSMTNCLKKYLKDG